MAIQMLGSQIANVTQGITTFDTSGSETLGEFVEIERGDPFQIPGLTLQMEPGKVYEVRYQTDNPIAQSLDFILAQISAIIGTFFGVQTLFIKTEGNLLRHQFWIPQQTASVLRERGLALPAIGTIIGAIVLVLVIIGIVTIILGFISPGGLTIENLIKAIPGFVVTVVGGVITGVLPGKTKIVGIVPIGIGTFMILEAFGFLGPSNGDGNGEPPGEVEFSSMSII